MMYLKALKPHIASSGDRHKVNAVYKEIDATAAKAKIESGICAAATDEEIEGGAANVAPKPGERQFVGLTNLVTVPAGRLDALEAAEAELGAAKARISELEARAGDADDETARASVEAARVEADGILASAKEDAAKIVDEAKAAAAKIVSGAEAETQKALNAELDRLKAAKPSGNGKK